jgi:hypothetical protein
MALLFFGTDPNSGGGNCPAVRVDTDTARGPELVLQGKFVDAVTRAACSQDSPPADDETVIRIPARMVLQIRKASTSSSSTCTGLNKREVTGPANSPGSPNSLPDRRPRIEQQSQPGVAVLAPLSSPAFHRPLRDPQRGRNLPVLRPTLEASHGPEPDLGLADGFLGAWE